MNHSTILITGASGFLGGILAQDLSSDFKIATTYNQKITHIKKCKNFYMNLYEPPTIHQVVQTVQPDVVIHCAAQPNGAICQLNPHQAEMVNVQGTRHLLNALPNPKTLFIYISTDLVFDGNQSFYSEVDTPKPVSIYGQTKLRAEQLIQSKWQNHIIIRTALMYGPNAPSGKGSFVQWMDQSLQKGQTLSLFNDEFRTPLFAHDVSTAIRQILSFKAYPFRIFNFGGQQRLSRYEFGYMLAQLRGCDPNKIKPVQLKNMSTGYPRPVDVSMNSSRIMNTFGLKPTEIHQGLEIIFKNKN